MLHSFATQIGAVAVLVVCLYALVFGAWRERFGAVFYLAAYGLSLCFGLISTEERPLYLLMVDVLCVQGFTVVAWKSPHPWPLWALAGQLICVVAALTHLFDFGLDEWVYLTIEMTAAWGVLLALLLGAISAAQARREGRHMAA